MTRIGANRSAAGRPLRAMALLGLALLVWIAVRLPVMVATVASNLTAMRPLLPPGPAAPPAMLALVATAVPLARRPDAPIPGPAAAALPMLASKIPAGYRASAAPIPTSVPPPPILPPPPTPTPTVAPAYTPPNAPPNAYDLAALAYARLAAGDRRAAARLFDAALASGADPRAARWRQDRDTLGHHWSGGAYTFIRDAGATGPTASPVLGGGQSGASLAYTIDPLARRPLAIVARLNAATDPASRQAAAGLQWHVRTGISISAERLIAIGREARNDWTMRIAAGAQRRRGPARYSAYGEAGILGNGDIYAGAQTRAAVAIARVGRIAIDAGPGGWASLQTGGTAIHRVDIGPSIAARIELGRASFDLAADWRFRIAGNAAPRSGPALTLSTRF